MFNMSLETVHNPRSTDSASATPSNGTDLDTSIPDAALNQSLSPQAPSSVVENHSQEVANGADNGPGGTTSPSPGVTREMFNAEMTFEPRGYRPVASYDSVEHALASKVDPAKFEVFVDVKKGGFTAEEVAAIPDNAKRNNYYLGFVRQLFDVNEGIFKKGFWTSSEGIKKGASGFRVG